MQRPERIDRRALGWAARRLFSARTGSDPDSNPPDRILIVRIDERVGNLVNLQSMIDAIKTKLPNVQLGLLASSRAGQIAGSLDGLDHLHLLDKRWFFKRHLTWRRVVSKIRQVGYQVALDTSAWHEFSFTHATLTYYSGAPIRIGYQRGEHVTSGYHTLQIRPGSDSEYELAQRMRLLEPLGIKAKPPKLRTSLGESEEQKWEDWLSSHQAKRPRIGIWPGSRKLERRWPVPYYIKLGKKLVQACEGSLVVLWGPGEEELCEEFAAAVPSDLIVAPKTSLKELAGILRRLDLVVTNDTGPMHLSVAVGRPTVCLFASGDPLRWGHPYSNVRNLAVPGADPQEVEHTAQVCMELLAKK